MAKQVSAKLSTSASLEVAEVYDLHFNTLRYLAEYRFGIPHGDAESLVHDAFISYIGYLEQIHDVRAWLVSAVCNSCRNYLRVRGRFDSLSGLPEQSDPASQKIAEAITLRIAARETLARLQQKCRDTLRLRYFEGHSASELATQLDTTNRYAEKLIYKCLKRAHEVYMGFNATRR
ncbi:MAG TPA: sigma-70 family RNA polymerase sigma factor [Thermoanaerobaculia bacterium]|nr:sigma-70 family RNA polymerase sigma factor [Thermoanaerobaculia bacterium]